MKRVMTFKKDKIARLNWCLEKLKFHDTGIRSEDYEYLYRFIFEMIVTMQEMDDKEALSYYYQRAEEGHLHEELLKMNIEL